MDWYLVVKFVHVVAAMAWLGGGLAMLVATSLVARDPDPAARLRFVSLMNALSLPLFVPSAMTVLVSGLAMCWLWVGLAEAWLVLALAGIAVSICIGAGFIKPVGERIVERAALEGVSRTVVSDMDRLARIGRFDYALMLSIVALMVFKPGWQDTAILFALGLLVSFAAALFLVPRRSAGIHVAV